MIKLFTTFCLLAAPSVFACISKGHNANTFRCVQYVSNYDGDTITFNIAGVHDLIGKNIRVRLSDIDTPEISTKNPCEKQRGLAAKRFVAAVLQNAKRIDLERVHRGKYFRLVADVKVDGYLLNDLLLKLRFAVPYTGGRKQSIDWCVYPTGG